MKEDKVLITFQVPKELRDASMSKAQACSINISEFLRHCLEDFTYKCNLETSIYNARRIIVEESANEALR